MKKRVMAFIGAVVLIVSCFVFPAAAEDSDQVTCSLLLTKVNDSKYVMSPVIYIEGPVVISGKVTSNSSSNPGLEFSYTVQNLRCSIGAALSFVAYGYDPSGTTNNAALIMQSSGYFNVRISTTVSSLTSVDWVTLTYRLSDVVSYVSNPCDWFGCFYPSITSQDDLDQARQEGYQTGYTEGAAAGRQEGYDDGYQAGLESTEDYDQGYADGVESGKQEGYAEGAEAGYQEGYTEGIEAGKQEGYTEGVTAGLHEAAQMYEAQSHKSIFAYAKMQVQAIYTDGDLEYDELLTNVPFDLDSGGNVTMSGRAMDYINAYFGNWFSSSYDQSKLVIKRVDFIWGSDNGTGYLWDWPANTPIYTNVSYLSYPNWSIGYNRYAPGDLDTASGSASLKSYDARSAFLTDPTYPSDSIYQMTLYFKFSPLDIDFGDTVLAFRTLTLSTPMTMAAEGYNTGYVAGYADGVAVVAGPLVDEAYDTGYGSGYALGFSNGKKEGLTISQTGDWKQLILAVVETPVNAFQNLFNFEVLGLDMRAAFGSILALCVLLIVLKKVIF